jgi:hypothetical protein
MSNQSIKAMKNLIVLFVLFSIFPDVSWSQTGSSCSQAASATIGENLTPNADYWYSFTVPENHKKIIFSYDGNTNDQIAFYVYRNCGDNIFDQRYSINGKIYLEITIFDSLETFYFEWRNLSSSSGIVWNLDIENLEPGDRCSISTNAVIGKNTFTQGVNWYAFKSQKDDQKVTIASKDLYYANGYFNLLDSCNGSGIYFDQKLFSDSIAITIPFIDSGDVFFFYLNSFDDVQYYFNLYTDDMVSGEYCGMPTTAEEGINHVTEVQKWYRYTMPASGKKITLSSIGQTDIDTYVEVLDSCNGNSISWNDDFFCPQSKLTFYDVDSSESILFKWGSNNLLPTAFNWFLSVDDLEEGDLCSLPKVVGEGEYNLPESKEWYSFTVPDSNKKILISSDIFNTGEFTVEVYDSCNGNLISSNIGENWELVNEISLYNLKAQQTILIHIFRSYPVTQGYSWKLSIKGIPELNTPEEIVVSVPKDQTKSEDFSISNLGEEELNGKVILPHSAAFNISTDFFYVLPNYDIVELNDSNLNPQHEISISFWLYLKKSIDCDAENNWRILICKDIAFLNIDGYDVLLEEDGNITFSVATTNGLMRYHTTSKFVPLQQWTHIVATYNATTGTAAIYVNGIKTAGEYWNHASGDIKPNYSYLHASYPVVSDCPSGFGAFPGNIDELSVWNKALTPEQISGGMLNQLKGNEPGLIGFWDFDAVEDMIVTDYSPYHNDGYLVNATNDLSTPFDWVSVSPVLFQVPNSDSYDLNVNFDATDLDTGTYWSKFTLLSDDPRANRTIVPVTMKVTPPSLVNEILTDSEGFTITLNPNPFDTRTIFEMSFADPGDLSLTIYNSQGKIVEQQNTTINSAGKYNYVFDGSGLSGGIYFYKADLTTYKGSNLIRSGKLVLVK